MNATSALSVMPLADAIRELRKNLSEAANAAEKEDLTFKVATVELELSVVATTEGSGGGKLSFNVLGIGAEANLGGKLSDATTHKIKLVLTPTKDGKDVNVSRRSG